MTFTCWTQQLDYLSNQIKNEFLHSCKSGHWLNQALPFNTLSSAPNNLSSLCLWSLQNDTSGRRRSVPVSTLILSQRAAGASRSVTESAVLWTMCLCFCTEPCDCHVSESMAKSHSGHLQISVCWLSDHVSWLSSPLLSFPLSLKSLAGILNTLQLWYCSLHIDIKVALFEASVVIISLLAFDLVYLWHLKKLHLLKCLPKCSQLAGM